MSIRSKLNSLRFSGSEYTVSFFGQIALVGAILVYLFSTTFNPAEANAFFTMILILIAGIVLTIALVGMPKFIPFNMKSLGSDAVSTAGSFIAVYEVNQVIPAQIGISPIGETSFAILAGVTEEWFFRMFLCTWFYKITKNIWISITVSSAIWAVFHLARYGGSPNLILIVFLAGLPLGFFTLYFKSSDGPVFAHMIINAIARGG